MAETDIPEDDLLDVRDLTRRLEKRISAVLKGNERRLSMSALMSASINCIMNECESIEQVKFYRDIFINILYVACNNMVVKDKKEST